MLRAFSRATTGSASAIRLVVETFRNNAEGPTRSTCAARADHEAAGTTPQEESAIVGERVASFMAQAPAVGSRLWSEPRLCRFPTRKQLDLFGSKHERICTLFFSLG